MSVKQNHLIAIAIQVRFSIIVYELIGSVFLLFTARQWIYHIAEIYFLIGLGIGIGIILTGEPYSDKIRKNFLNIYHN